MSLTTTRPRPGRATRSSDGADALPWPLRPPDDDLGPCQPVDQLDVADHVLHRDFDLPEVGPGRRHERPPLAGDDELQPDVQDRPPPTGHPLVDGMAHRDLVERVAGQPQVAGLEAEDQAVQPAHDAEGRRVGRPVDLLEVDPLGHGRKRVGLGLGDQCRRRPGGHGRFSPAAEKETAGEHGDDEDERGRT
jgi:hypothetical protein